MLPLADNALRAIALGKFLFQKLVLLFKDQFFTKFFSELPESYLSHFLSVHESHLHVLQHLQLEACLQQFSLGVPAKDVTLDKAESPTRIVRVLMSFMLFLLFMELVLSSSHFKSTERSIRTING